MTNSLRRVHHWLAQTLRPRRRVQDLDEELRFHLEQCEAAYRAAGCTAAEAHRRALVDFGGVERTREDSNRQRPGWWLETIAQDLRYALRGFRRNPAFAFTVVATLALGIGATTAVFSVVDRILFRPLPYAHDERLVSVGLVQSLERQEFTLGAFFFDWRDTQKPFEAMASQGTMLHACNLVERNPAQLKCIHAQAGFLPLLGISPVLGRGFLPEEDRPNGPRVALISYGLWQGHYNRDAAILNRLIELDGNPVRIVGVLPKDFELPTVELPDVMLPLALNEGLERRSSPGHPMRTFARLKPGVSLTQARAELEPLFLRTQQTVIPPEIRNDFHLSVRSLRDRETQDVQKTSWILLGAVLAMLLIAWANVAGLMVARGEARERELAVRSALGANRARLVRQTLTEALLLALAGASAGLVLAEGLLRVFLALAPTGIPFLHRAGLDLRIASFSVLLSLVCGTLFGLMPAWKKPRDLARTARTASGRREALLRRGLVVSQIAIGMALLAAAGLLVKSFANMERQNLGMHPSGVLTARIALPGFRYDTGQKKMEFYLQLETALRRLPGVRAVAFSDSIPPGGWHDDQRLGGLAADGRRPTPSPGNGGPVVSRGVTPGYFQALDIPIVRGRSFTEEDASKGEYPVVLSRLLAARLFPGEEAVGRRIQKGQNGIWLTVVGVAENVRNGGLAGQDDPEIYFLRRRVPEDWGGRAPVGEVMSGAAPIALVDSDLPSSTLAPWVRAQIAQLDPTVPVEMEPLTQMVSRLADRSRFETALLAFFAFCGLGMASIGIYGLVAYLAAQRTREIGVRMALGATRLDALRLVAREGVRLTALGVVAGLIGALMAARMLGSLLYQVAPYDPWLYAGAAALLGVVALAAALIPARRAAAIEPMAALRHE